MKKINYFFLMVVTLLSIGCTKDKQEEQKEEFPLLEAPYVRMKVKDKWWVCNKQYEGDVNPFFLVDREGFSQEKKYFYRFELFAKDDTKGALLGDDFMFFSFRMPFTEKPKVGVDYSFTLSDETYGSDNQMNMHDFGFSNPKAYDIRVHSYASYVFNSLEQWSATKKLIGESYPYTIRFTEIKELKKKESSDTDTYYAVSGVFSGKMINWETGEIIEITQGEFKSKL